MADEENAGSQKAQSERTSAGLRQPPQYSPPGTFLILTAYPLGCIFRVEVFFITCRGLVLFLVRVGRLCVVIKSGPG